MTSALGVVLRGLVTLVVAAGALLALDPILSGFDVPSFKAAVGTVAVAAVLNALLWPLLVRIALPLTVLTIGFGALALNALVVLLAAAIVPDVEIDTLVDGIIVVLAVTAATTLAGAAMSIDDDARFDAHLTRLRARPRNPIRSDVPGVLFLEIDGLAHPVLQQAIRDGVTPTLAAWINDESHELGHWETDWSSQTGACQAGILHGNNYDMPAFRWWEKERGAPIVTNHPRDAAELQARISDGRGLLHDDGASRANILSGDAVHSLLTMSTVLDVRRGRLGADYFSYFASPYNMARTLLLTLSDVAVELGSALRQRRRDIRPRVHRGFAYAPMRAFATAIQLDLQVESVIGDIQAGRPTVYTTFLAYDEVAHHSGIARADTLAVLHRVDRRIARIAAAAARGPRPYEVVVLSDHGQTQGTTFRDRYGITLEELVREACNLDADAVASSGSGEDEARGRFAAALTEASTGSGAGARAVRVATERRAVDGEVRLDDEVADAGDDGDALPELAVMASGCLGLITFPRLPGRVTRETIDRNHPKLLDALRAHPGIGFVLVREEGGTDVVLGAAGERRLTADGSDDEVVGEDPLAPFGPRAAAHIRRTARFPHCPDLLVNSSYWSQTDEVAAFEELVGSHGGLGGPQSKPFLLAPASLPLPDGEIVGAEHIHRLFRGWLARLGHAAFQDDDAAPQPADATAPPPDTIEDRPHVGP